MKSLPTYESPWRTLESRTVYRNPWIAVREDQVITPDGSAGIYGVVEPKIATGVVALETNGDIWLVGQYRYPTNSYSWEIIEGAAEANEAPQSAAARELAEEAGLIAESWEPLLSEIHLSNCFSAERAFLFLARNLRQTEVHPDSTEILQTMRIPLTEAVTRVESGEINDAVTVIALFAAARRIR